MNGEQMDRTQIQEQLNSKQTRLKLYYDQEAKMLSGGVLSYGIGNRNLARYNTDLASIRYTIKSLEDEIKDLQNLLNGKSARKSVGIIPRDW